MKKPIKTKDVFDVPIAKARAVMHDKLKARYPMGTINVDLHDEISKSFNLHIKEQKRVLRIDLVSVNDEGICVQLKYDVKKTSNAEAFCAVYDGIKNALADKFFVRRDPKRL